MIFIKVLASAIALMSDIVLVTDAVVRLVHYLVLDIVLNPYHNDYESILGTQVVFPNASHAPQETVEPYVKTPNHLPIRSSGFTRGSSGLTSPDALP